jgi:hypothetical protein
MKYHRLLFRRVFQFGPQLAQSLRWATQTPVVHIRNAIGEAVMHLLHVRSQRAGFHLRRIQQFLLNRNEASNIRHVYSRCVASRNTVLVVLYS